MLIINLSPIQIASLGYSDTIIFRPAFLAQANRGETRKVEQIYGFLTHNILSRFWNDAEIKVTDLAKAFLIAGKNGSSGLTSLGVGSPPSDSFNRVENAKGTITIIKNIEAIQLAKQTEKASL